MSTKAAEKNSGGGMTCCELSGHLDQIRDYPVGTMVENTVALAAASGAVPIGSKGCVTLHCADGRAWIVFDGYPVGHTFHDPAKYVRIVSPPSERKAAEINLDDRRQPFAGVATIRAAIFDVMDRLNPLIMDRVLIPDKVKSEDRENFERSTFVDAVIARIAELQQPPHEGVKLENLCDKHKPEVLPLPTASVCPECAAERRSTWRLK